MSALSDKAKVIFLDAIEKYAPQDWPNFLTQACEANYELRERVEELLQAHSENDSLFDRTDRDDRTVDLKMPRHDIGEQIGPYKLLQQLGEGGMGVVYLAERQHPHKQRVAIKIIKQGMDSRKFIARFEAERQALAMMDHPNISKVLDAGCTDHGRPYFVMELVKGVPINQFCDDNRFTTRERLELFSQVCRAVHHAHQKGIIHRDLKPSNVLVALYDDKPVPKVIDFGVAKATNQQLTDKTLFTEVGSILGTWEYMSPEQAVLNQLDVDTRTDVYSLGVLLYELLTGETPLDRQRLRQAQVMETLRMIREDEPVKPSTRVSSLGEKASTMATYRRSKPESLASEIRGDLDWIVMTALDKERSRRYDSASRLEEDITRFLNNELVEARPPSTWYRFQRFYQRHAALMLSACAVVVALSIGLLVAMGALRSTRMANVRLQQQKQQLEETQSELNRSLDAETRAKQNAVEAHDESENRRVQAEEDLYFNDMRFAAIAFEDNNFAMLRQLLRKHIPGEGEVDRRGVEWFYLAGLLQRWNDFDSLEHGRTLSMLSLSPGGRLLASADIYGHVKLWDMASREARKFGTGGSAAGAFVRDGFVEFASIGGETLVVHESPDGDVMISSLDGVQRFQIEHDELVQDVSVSQDGKYLATVTGTKCRVWNLESDSVETIREYKDPGVRHLQRVTFSTDGTMLAYGGKRGNVWVRRLNEDSEFLLDGHRFRLQELEFSPDGKFLGTACADGKVIVWDLATRQPQLLGGHDDSVRALAFSQDGKWLATAGRERIVKLWDIKTLGLRATIRGHSSVLDDLLFTENGDMLFGAGSSGRIHLWEMAKLANLQDLCYLEQPANVSSDDAVAMSANGDLLLVAKNAKLGKGKLELWDTARLEKKEPFVGLSNDVARIATSSRNQLLTVGSDSDVRLWDLESKADLGRVQLPNGTTVTSLVFSCDGEWAAIGDQSGRVGVYQLSPFLEQPVLRVKHHNDKVSCLAISPDNQWVASIDRNGKLKIWQREDGTPVEEFDFACEAWISKKLEFSPDPAEPSLAILWSGVRVWNWKDKEKPYSLPHPGYFASSLAFSSDGRNLITTAAEGTLHFWDMELRRERIKFKKHRHAIHHLAASHDRRVLVTVGRHGTIRTWRIPTAAEIDLSQLE